MKKMCYFAGIILLVAVCMAVHGSTNVCFAASSQYCSHKDCYTETIKSATCTESGLIRYICKACGFEAGGMSVAALGHNYSAYKVTTNVTCTKNGVETSTCSRCSAKKTRSIAAPGHNFVLTKTVNATCTAEGSNTYTCSRCNTTKSDPISKISHNYEWVTTAQATCTQDGKQVNKCKVCGKIAEEKTIPIPGHKFMLTKTVNATCAKEGSNTYTCSVCKATKTEIIPKTTDHKYEWVITAQATCTQMGKQANKCKVCGKIAEEKTIPIPGHKYVLTKTVNATCAKEGSNTYTCSVCKATKTETISKTNDHKYSWVTKKAATCTQNGEQVYKCSVCGKEADGKTIIAPGHKYEVTKTVPATCAETGTKTYTCSVCKATKTETIPKTNDHQYEWKTETEASCTKDGEMVNKCKVCGKEVDGKVIPAKGHKYKLIKTVDANCAKEGSKEYKCDTCGTPKTETIPKTNDHQYEWKTETEASCTKDGEMVNKCKLCGKEVDGKVIPATGHKYKLIKTVDATCAKEGSKEYKCDACGTTKTETIAKTNDHQYEWKTETEASCTKDGEMVNKCKVCGKEVDGKVIPAKGHKYKLIKTVDATCKKEGSKEYKCDVCGDTKTDKIPKTNDHQYEWITKTKATCTKDGEKVHRCSVCKKEFAGKVLPALGHKWGKASVKSGVKTYKCSRCPEKKEEYIITYDTQGGTAVDDQVKKKGVNLKLKGTPEKEGYDFEGWSVKKDDTTIYYKPGSIYDSDKPKTLYAVWKEKVYTIKYVGGAQLPETQYKQHFSDKSIKLSEEKPTMTGREFIGWSTVSSDEKPDYYPGDKYSENKDVFMHAVWKVTCRHHYEDYSDATYLLYSGKITYKICRLCGTTEIVSDGSEHYYIVQETDDKKIEVVCGVCGKSFTDVSRNEFVKASFNLVKPKTTKKKKINLLLFTYEKTITIQEKPLEVDKELANALWMAYQTGNGISWAQDVCAFYDDAMKTDSETLKKVCMGKVYEFGKWAGNKFVLIEHAGTEVGKLLDQLATGYGHAKCLYMLMKNGANYDSIVQVIDAFSPIPFSGKLATAPVDIGAAFAQLLIVDAYVCDEILIDTYKAKYDKLPLSEANFREMFYDNTGESYEEWKVFFDEYKVTDANRHQYHLGMQVINYYRQRMIAGQYECVK